MVRVGRLTQVRHDLLPEGPRSRASTQKGCRQPEFCVADLDLWLNVLSPALNIAGAHMNATPDYS